MPLHSLLTSHFEENISLLNIWCSISNFSWLIFFFNLMSCMLCRVGVLALGWIVFFAAFLPVHFLIRGHDKWRRKIEFYLEGCNLNTVSIQYVLISVYGICAQRKLVEMMCSVFVASWTGVIKYHGPRPSIRPQQVFVANHTSMIDFIILEQMTAFAVIMQKHPGWVGFIQKTILESVGCIWFNRTEVKDREVVARKIREHTQGVDNNPLLIFPEGTCVNNHYTVMFKKGAFELGCAVCPVAIKYNKIFVDAFWNSKKQSFTTHLAQLMTSWAVVCDVWYLEPQYIRPGETPIEFAERVRDMISVRAGLKKVPWDGYLKYFRPSPKLTERKYEYSWATDFCRICATAFGGKIKYLFDETLAVAAIVDGSNNCTCRAAVGLDGFPPSVALPTAHWNRSAKVRVEQGRLKISSKVLIVFKK
ncbi:hypothetical protein ZIOFF_001816 [Zingiber officinale]|uniref:Phospholipid/glycerol acyltransferase domain-containing protein n=1 Tax=Zingiber officinale TaxID=94328 RepID=A0A8J5LVB9_ZINOF|nr:hypothetical protein ZIOFF_001816 [Zingiber officinale]